MTPSWEMQYVLYCVALKIDVLRSEGPKQQNHRDNEAELRNAVYVVLCSIENRCVVFGRAKATEPKASSECVFLDMMNEFSFK